VAPEITNENFDDFLLIEEIIGFGFDDDTVIVYSSKPLTSEQCEKIRDKMDGTVKFFTVGKLEK